MPTPNANNDKFVIKTPELGERPGTLAAWEKFWTADERIEVFNRYCDIKDREAKYRKSAAETAKRVKAYLLEQGVDPKDL